MSVACLTLQLTHTVPTNSSVAAHQDKVIVSRHAHKVPTHLQSLLLRRSCLCAPLTAELMSTSPQRSGRVADITELPGMSIGSFLQLQSKGAFFREVQQQLNAVEHAQAQLWAERSQLAVEQQAVAEDKALAVRNAQEAATAHASLLMHLRQTRAHSVMVAPQPFHVYLRCPVWCR